MSDSAAAPNAPWSYLGHDVFSVSSRPLDHDDGQINSKGPALLLVHGFGASTDHWRFNIPVISRTHEVHALDLLGFGRSAKPSDLNYGGELWRKQLVAYVNERIGRPTVLVGNSLGGYAALAAGADLGKDAAGVVLLNAAGYFSDSTKRTTTKGLLASIRQKIGGPLRDPFHQRLIFEYLRNPFIIRRTLNQVYIDSTNVDDALVDAIRRPSLDQGAFGVFRSVFSGNGRLHGQPLDELFAELDAPLLLLWGNLDPWMNAVGKRASFKRYAPANTTEVVLNAGHCPHDEIPDQVNSHLLEWLQAS